MVSARLRHFTLVIAFTVVVVLLTTPALASVTLDTSSTYDGLNGDTQSITAEITLTPNDSMMSDVVIDIDETDSAFIDFNSFQQTINPGAANINVTYTGNGEFQISELEPDEDVTIEFKTYPRTVKSEQLAAADVHVSFVQNGQNLDRRETIMADMSSSPWFAYNDAKNSAPTPIWIIALAVVGGLSLVGGSSFGIYSLLFKEDETEKNDIDQPGRNRR